MRNAGASGVQDGLLQSGLAGGSSRGEPTMAQEEHAGTRAVNPSP